MMDFPTPWKLEKNDKWWEIRDANDDCVLDTDSGCREEVMRHIVNCVNRHGERDERHIVRSTTD